MKTVHWYLLFTSKKYNQWEGDRYLLKDMSHKQTSEATRIKTFWLNLKTTLRISSTNHPLQSIFIRLQITSNIFNNQPRHKNLRQNPFCQTLRNLHWWSLTKLILSKRTRLDSSLRIVTSTKDSKNQKRRDKPYLIDLSWSNPMNFHNRRHQLHRK